MIPHIDQLRDQGKLNKGQKDIIIYNTIYEFNGELDIEGKACGLGLATADYGSKYEGIFYNDERIFCK